jgi:ketol-acid reductoisomerase
MRQILREIREGTFAQEWIAEYRRGAPRLYETRAREQGGRIEEVGRALRRMMPWLARRDVPVMAPRAAEAVAAGE